MRYRTNFLYFFVCLSIVFLPLAANGQERPRIIEVTSFEVLTSFSPSQVILKPLVDNQLIKKSQQNSNTILISLTDFRGNITRTLGEIETSDPTRIFISNTSKRVIVNYKEQGTGKRIARIYALDTNKVFTLRDEQGDVAFPVLSPADGRILYQLRTLGEPPKIYVADSDGQNPEFVANGVGQKWSPDGKGYIVKSTGVNPLEAYKYGKISRQEMQREMQARKEKNYSRKVQYWFYYQDLNSPELIPDLKNPNPEIEFSPQGQILAILDGAELYIRSYSMKNGTISWLNKEIIDRMNPIYEIDRIFSWDPDGQKVAYSRLYLDASGHNYVKSKIFIYDLHAKRSYPLTKQEDVYEVNPVWTKNSDLIIVQKNIWQEKGQIVKLNLKLK